MFVFFLFPKPSCPKVFPPVAKTLPFSNYSQIWVLLLRMHLLPVRISMWKIPQATCVTFSDIKLKCTGVSSRSRLPVPS